MPLFLFISNALQVHGWELDSYYCLPQGDNHRNRGQRELHGFGRPRLPCLAPLLRMERLVAKGGTAIYAKFSRNQC